MLPESNSSDFQKRFRELRKKRYDQRDNHSTRAKVKRPKLKGTENTGTDKAFEHVSQEGGDRPSEADTSNTIESRPQRSSRKASQDKPVRVKGTNFELNNEGNGERETGARVPRDFFEINNHKLKAELDKKRRDQQTNAEYQRFHREIAGSLEEINEKDVAEAEEAVLHREQMEAYEQQQRMSHIQNLKTRRFNLPTTNSRQMPAADSKNDTSSSDDDDDVTVKWRSKKL